MRNWQRAIGFYFFVSLLLSRAPRLAAAPDLFATPVRQALEQKVARDPGDIYAWNRLVSMYLELLRGTGEMAWLGKAESAVGQSLAQVPPAFNKGALIVRGQVEMAGHHFAVARATAQEYEDMQPGQVAGCMLRFDADFELGNYAEAEQTLIDLQKIEEGPSINSASRRAKTELMRGHTAAARQQLQTALEMVRKWDDPAPLLEAWCLVQLGEQAFRQGEWESAESDYTAALKIAPGWFPAEEHLAELRGAQGNIPEAIATYGKLAERTGRPDLAQAVGDLYKYSVQEAKAKVWYDRAGAEYHRSVEAGEILFLHHGAGFYVDSVREPAIALKWATQDWRERKSLFAWDSLAWAQYAAGQLAPATESIAKALATGVKDPHILYHAGLIRMSAGDLAGGRAAMQECLQINPRYQSFHVHR